MLPSRGVPLLRTFKLLNRGSLQCKPSVRNSHASWNYRTAAPPASKNTILLAEAVQGMAWWWILWHLWTQYDHITGEFDYPDPSQWTDEELGIPSEE